MKLQRSIGTLGLLFSAIGGIIGSGWLLGPMFAAQIAGPAALLSWVIGGLVMMVIALTYAELASMLPVPGGMVRFLQFSHGTFSSYTMGWIGWLASAAVPPVETMALMHYVNNYVPGLMHTVAGTPLLTGLGFFVAVVLLFIMCIVNFFGVKLLSSTNSFMVFLKLIFPLITIITLLCLSFHHTNFTSMGFAPYGLHGVLTALPAAGVIFSFIGYTPAIMLAGEAKNPQRAIPIAVLGSLILCMILYLFLQAAFIGSLAPSDFAHGWANLSFSGDTGPFAGIAMTLGVIWLSNVLLAGAIISPFGTALLYTGATARLTYAMGQNGYMPNFLMKLNGFGIPARILGINFIIGVILFLPFPTWQGMMSFLVSALTLAYAVGPLALGILRKKLPKIKRPFKIKWVTFTNLSGFYICNLIIYWTGWDTISKMLAAIALGYIVLVIYLFTQSGKKLDLNFEGGWWFIPYFIVLGILSKISAFGGGTGALTFGWDFLVIAVFTTIVYYVAQYAGMQCETSLIDAHAHAKHELDSEKDSLV